MALTAPSAMAAFPGHNGLLAVAPLHGPGILITTSHGTGQHVVCPVAVACPVVDTPSWSPDGQAVAFSSAGGQGISIIYDDGSCLDCEPFGNSDFTTNTASMPAFTATPGLLSTVMGGNVTDFGTDGLMKQTVLSGHVSDAVWSAQGKLAAVRSGRVLAGSPGHLRSLGRGRDPSWSANGSRLALVRRGWVTVVRVGHRGGRRLAKGAAPAFSPDGKRIAFIGGRQRLSVVSSGGGRVHRVADVRGRDVEWQPITGKPPQCTAPPGSNTVVSSSDAVVTADVGPGLLDPSSNDAPAYMSCVLSTGRERLLTRYDLQSYDAFVSGSDFVIAGNFTALLEHSIDEHYGGSSATVRVFDLSTGAESQLSGESTGCPDYSGYGCSSAADQLVLNDEGFTAMHITVAQPTATGTPPAQATEEIVATDRTGTDIEDSITEAEAGPLIPSPQLTELRLSGDTLTWLHDGSPRSAQLS